jgi:hypothetical protein
MSSNYVIRWKSKVNGRAGRGTKCFERAEAERLAEELNREYPQIEHEAVKMSSSPTDQAAQETADKSSYALTE